MKNLFKKWWFWLIAIVVVIGIIGAAGGSDTDTSVSTNPVTDIAETMAPVDSIDNLQCEIVSATLGGKTYDGKPTVVVTYQFTNNSTEPAAFYTSFTDTVYQNGIECERSYNLEETNEDKEIKPGATIEVVLDYELNDTTSDIEVEIAGWLSWDENVISKTFKIA
jgi:hypothetical protein